LQMATGQAWDTTQVGDLLGRRIREKLAGYELSAEPDLTAFSRRFGGQGVRARVQGPDGPAEGTILGVAADGALEVALDGHQNPWRVRSGEVDLLDQQTGGG
ncbi:MAG: hypothetical protein VX938_12230, partial [Myxococcota bacterium]|nr:hypothetical protein [Myxococcota bacterium]